MAIKVFGRRWNPYGPLFAWAIMTAVVAVVFLLVWSNDTKDKAPLWWGVGVGSVSVLLWTFLTGFIDA